MIFIGTKLPGKDKLIIASAGALEEMARKTASCSCAGGCAAGTRGEGNRSLSFAALAPAGKGQTEFVFCRDDMTAASSLLLSLCAPAGVHSRPGTLIVLRSSYAGLLLACGAALAAWEKRRPKASRMPALSALSAILRSRLEPFHHPPGGRRRWSRRTMGCIHRPPDWPLPRSSRTASRVTTGGWS